VYARRRGERRAGTSETDELRPHTHTHTHTHRGDWGESLEQSGNERRERRGQRKERQEREEREEREEAREKSANK
jgi:hypothetical protein